MSCLRTRTSGGSSSFRSQSIIYGRAIQSRGAIALELPFARALQPRRKNGSIIDRPLRMALSIGERDYIFCQLQLSSLDAARPTLSGMERTHVRRGCARITAEPPNN